MTGHERELAISPADKKKTVLVVGGGSGGMEAARVAALRGHKVTLWEKGHALGGNLILASIPDFKRDYRSFIEYLRTQIRKLGVTVKLRKEATVEAIQELKPEVVILATGGVFTTLPIPGIDRDNVVDVRDLRDMVLGNLKWSSIKQKKGGQKILWFAGNTAARFLKPSTTRWLARFWAPFGKRVIVMGGGLGEYETALHLAQRGRKVTVLETSDSPMADIFLADRMHMLELLAGANVKILTSVNVLEITNEGVIIADKDGKKSTLECDTVLLDTSLKANIGLSEVLKGKVPEVYTVGDCVEPRRIMGAVGEGFRTARLI